MSPESDLIELKAVISALLDDVAYLGDGGDQEAVAEAIRMAEHLHHMVVQLGGSTLVIKRLDLLIKNLKLQTSDEGSLPCEVDIYGQVLAVHGAFARQLGYLT